MIKTQADRLAELYSDIHAGKEMPAEIEQDSISEELEEISEAQLPKLNCVVKDKGDLLASMPAAILAQNKLFYFELACTSSVTAHAIAGALAENRVDATWRMKWPGVTNDFLDIDVPEKCQIQDCRLAVTGWNKQLHHLAVLDRTGELLIADTDETLWSKLRVRMSCPTQEAWCAAIMPRVHRAGILVKCNTTGIPENLKAYVLAPDANDLFDAIVGEYVLKNGL